MATKWLTVHDRLTQLLPTLPGWAGVEVFVGRAVTGDAPTDYVTVGYAQLEDSGGDFSHEPHSGGWGTNEVGSVRCELVCSSGDPTDMDTLRVRAFTLIDELEAEIRRDQTLGVLRPGSTSRLVVDVVPSQTTAGAQHRLAFTLEYLTVTD